MSVCSSSTQINDSKPDGILHKGIQQYAEGKGIVDISETYKNKLKDLKIVKGKVVKGWRYDRRGHK